VERKLDTLSSIVRGMANGTIRRFLEVERAEKAVSAWPCRGALPTQASEQNYAESLYYAWDTAIHSAGCTGAVVGSDSCHEISYNVCPMVPDLGLPVCKVQAAASLTVALTMTRVHETQETTLMQSMFDCIPFDAQRLQRLLSKLQPKREAVQEDAADNELAVMSGNRDMSASLLPADDRYAAFENTPEAMCGGGCCLCMKLPSSALELVQASGMYSLCCGSRRHATRACSCSSQHCGEQLIMPDAEW